MSTYRRFVFDSYALDPHARTIKLHYSLDDSIYFTETITFPGGTGLNFDHPDLDRALFALHLSGGASYYKTYCPPEIEIRSGRLTASQASFFGITFTPPDWASSFTRTTSTSVGLLTSPPPLPDRPP